MLVKPFQCWILVGLLTTLAVVHVLADDDDDRYNRTNEDIHNTLEAHDDDDDDLPSGRFQSPIDIEVSAAQVNRSLAFELVNYNTNISPIVTLFDGHTIKLMTKYVQNKPEVVYDNQVFLLNEIHFHWGEDPQNGSEHSFNGEFYALEAHLVHYSNRYPSAYKAQKHRDGMLVMSVLYRLQDAANQQLDELIQIIGRVSGRQIDTMSADRLSPKNLLPKNRDHFFTYFGSLTSLPFSESVRWIVFADTSTIGNQQLDQIRRTAQYNSRGLPDGWRSFSNTRDQQPLHGRNVQTNSNEQRQISSDASNDSSFSTPSSSSFSSFSSSSTPTGRLL